jgi:ParB-like chromosome segregation protein Spo0J
MMSIDELKRGPMVRVVGEDYEHAQLLASTPRPVPPILVHRSTMTVIDGMHRLLAAGLRGEKTIAVRFFGGSDDEAFVAAVQANIEHGKPLNLVDREKAAEKLTVLHPDWSDRVIGDTCAVSPKTVASIRRRATEESPRSLKRTGRDGRARPMDPTAGRQRIATAVRDDPGATLRQIAAQTGTSVGTVADVRRRLAAGKSAIPNKRQRGADQDRGTTSLYGPWAEDAACRSTKGGSQFAEWFDSARVRPEECHQYVEVPPLSRLFAIAAESHARAHTWAQYAADLENRARREAPVRSVE